MVPKSLIVAVAAGGLALAALPAAPALAQAEHMPGEPALGTDPSGDPVVIIYYSTRAVCQAAAQKLGRGFVPIFQLLSHRCEQATVGPFAGAWGVRVLIVR